jgi:hypothetical protein
VFAVVVPGVVIGQQQRLLSRGLRGGRRRLTDKHADRADCECDRLHDGGLLHGACQSPIH